MAQIKSLVRYLLMWCMIYRNQKEVNQDNAKKIVYFLKRKATGVGTLTRQDSD